MNFEKNKAMETEKLGTTHIIIVAFRKGQGSKVFGTNQVKVKGRDNTGLTQSG